MARSKVIITDYVNDDLRPEREVLHDIADVVALDAVGETQLDGRLGDADALMVFHNVSLSRQTISQLAKCRVIARVGVGFDNVDGQAAREAGIPLVNVPDYGTEEVADSAIGMMLALTRGLLRYNQRCKDPQTVWNYLPAAPLYRLRGRVFGIVGLGRIGTATAMRAKALGMDVAYFDPYRQDGYDKALGIRRCDTLEALFRESHVLSVHCPLTSETRKLIESTSLTWLPPGAFVINTARGPICDTDALLAAVVEKRLAGVGLDV
ncbi:MAG: C-terminal binding protein, partial [Planctomycetales bacterium]|nr:C-terminal binding protein [Planctomycetales bacterium]